MLPILIMIALNHAVSSAGAVTLHLQSDAAKVPTAVRSLAGTYIGAWTMYGLSDKGEPVKKFSWTDTMRAENPQVKDGQAFVETTDEMKFDGQQAPGYTVKGREGYRLTKQGKLASYFMNISGQEIGMVRLKEDVWTYVVPVTAQDIGLFGLPKEATGQHVLVKVVTKEKGAETHRISRLTTVSWTDKDGNQKAAQFVSLQGFHRKKP